jgi:hypothetical protein
MSAARTDPVSVVGKVSQAIISRERTILVGGGGDASDRVDFMENFMTGNVVLGEFDQDVISERISKLKGGIQVI